MYINVRVLRLRPYDIVYMVRVKIAEDVSKSRVWYINYAVITTIFFFSEHYDAQFTDDSIFIGRSA